jgi:hypothetical protein
MILRVRISNGKSCRNTSESSSSTPHPHRSKSKTKTEATEVYTDWKIDLMVNGYGGGGGGSNNSSNLDHGSQIVADS